MAGKYPITVGPRDIEAAIDVQLEICQDLLMAPHGSGSSNGGHYKAQYIKACKQGVLDFGRVARRKFNGFISSPDENKAVGLQVRRLCSKKFDKQGNFLTDYCILGADNVMETVDLIGHGKLRRKDKLSGKRR
jgi:hypothetical protein